MVGMANDGITPYGGVRAAPHNLEAEQALLGAILFDNETFNRITDRLKSEHFYDPVHGKIYDALMQFIRQSRLADGITISEHFRSLAALNEIGGAQYLVLLLENAARLTAQAIEYAELIYDLALRRSLIQIGEEITSTAQVPPEDANGGQLLEAAERRLFALAETGIGTAGFQEFHRAMAVSIEIAAAAYENKSDVSGIATGLVDLDRSLGGLHSSDLIILAGRPSMGKTALGLNIAFNIARARLEADRLPKVEGQKRQPGGVVGFFSLEMSAEQLATRLLSDAASIESDRIRRGAISKHDFVGLRDEAAKLERLPLHIDETGGISITQLITRARRLHRTAGLDVLIVDYLQLITSNARKGDGRVQEVSEITQGLKTLAKTLKIPVIALSQLSRQVEQREDKRPQLSDLRESGSIEQDADVVMFVYRESYYLERLEPKNGTDEHMAWQRQMDEMQNQAEVIIGKQRHGPIGKVKLHYEGRYTRFGNLATREPTQLR